MLWILVALALVGVIWLFISILRDSTVYLAHPGGFTAFNIGESANPSIAVTRERYKRILDRFFEGDLFDSLSVSRLSDENEPGGVVLSTEDEGVEALVTFLAIKEAALLAEFRKQMATTGYEPVEANRWNQGLGDELESETLEYRLPRDRDRVSAFLDQALDVLQGSEQGEVYVSAWRSQDGPSRLGIRIVRHRDVLAEVP